MLDEKGVVIMSNASPCRTARKERSTRGVLSLAYDFGTRAGRIDFQAGDVCDLASCIGLFRGIDPDVRCIDTFSGGALDIRYCLDDWGRWVGFIKRKGLSPQRS